MQRQWKKFDASKIKNHTGEKFSIGIVTYIARYDRFFKQLIHQLTSIFPDVEIIVMINGHYDLAAQNEYLKKISGQLNQFQNVKYTTHHNPEGLSKLWNKIILNASTEHVFIFNDDISVSPKLREELFSMKKDTITLINNSWSHFMISKKIIHEIGWFDERFPAIGNEDQDYEFRLLAKQHIPNVVYNGEIKNLVEQPTTYSYGKNMKTVNGKYSADNWNFFTKKWEISAEEKPNYLYSTKFNLWFNPLPKLETPNFYPLTKHE